MNYIEWNEVIWNYYFKKENVNRSVVLAASNRALKNIGERNDIDNPEEDFNAAIAEGPVDPNPYRFPFNENDGLLKKAKCLLKWWRDDKEVYIIKGSMARLQKWNSKNIPPYIAYLFYLILHVENEDRDYWQSLSQKLGYLPKTNDRKIVLELFEDLKRYTQIEKTGQFGHLYCESVYKETKKKHYVGRIYSQLPLTQEEEKQIKASLLGLSQNIHRDFLKDEEVLMEIFFKEKKYLNPPTRTHLADDSSALKNIIINFFIRNISDYLLEIPEEKEELQRILDDRKNKEKSNDPEHIQFIESINSQLVIRDGFVIDETITNLGREGSLILKNRKTRVILNLRSFFNSAYNSLEETVYFFDSDELSAGKYINSEKELTFTFQKRPLEFPLFVVREKTGRKIFRILEGENITYQNHDLYMFSAVELSHRNLSYIQKVPQQNQSNSPFTETILYKIVGTESNIRIADKTINLINRELKLQYLGLNDGISGIKSFNFGFPLKIIVSGAEVKKWVLTSSDEKIKSGNLSHNYKNLEEENIIDLEKLNPREYKLRLYGEDGIEILPTNGNLTLFSITNEVRDKRIHLADISMPFYEGDELFSLPPNFEVPKNYDFILSKKFLNQVLDHLIITGSFGNRYKKFTALLTHYLTEEFDGPAFITDETFISELRGELINTLDLIGVIDVQKEPQENIQLVKPFWWKSSLDNRHYIRGAICKAELERFNSSSDLKVESNYKLWVFKKDKRSIRFKIELPDIYWCKHRSKLLPKFNGLIINEEGEYKGKFKPVPTTNTITAREISENIPRHLVINESTNSKLSLALNKSKSISYFNWRKYKFEVIKDQAALDKLFEFSGIRLLRVQVDKIYNNYQEYHYLLFSKEEKDLNWKYTYYERENWRQARFDFIKNINYFDFTFDLEDDQKLKELFQFFAKKGIFKQEEANDLKKLKSKINYAMQIPLYLPDLKRRLVIYDENLKIFGVIVYLKPIKQIEKALVALSGRAPGEIYLEGVDIERTLYHHIGNEKLTTVKTLPYRIYYDVPENVADDLSFQLLSKSNYKTEYKHYQAIDLHEAANTCI